MIGDEEPGGEQDEEMTGEQDAEDEQMETAEMQLDRVEQQVQGRGQKWIYAISTLRRG